MPPEARTYLPRENAAEDACDYPVRCVVGPRRVVAGRGERVDLVEEQQARDRGRREVEDALVQRVVEMFGFKKLDNVVQGILLEHECAQNCFLEIKCLRWQLT